MEREELLINKAKENGIMVDEIVELIECYNFQDIFGAIQSRNMINNIINNTGYDIKKAMAYLVAQENDLIMVEENVVNYIEENHYQGFFTDLNDLFDGCNAKEIVYATYKNKDFDEDDRYFKWAGSFVESTNYLDDWYDEKNVFEWLYDNHKFSKYTYLDYIDYVEDLSTAIWALLPLYEELYNRG